MDVFRHLGLDSVFLFMTFFRDATNDYFHYRLFCYIYLLRTESLNQLLLVSPKVLQLTVK